MQRQFAWRQLPGTSMNLQQSPTVDIERSDVRNGSETRLHGRWLFFARTAWMTIAALIMGLNLIAIPSFYAIPRLVCTSTTACAHGIQFSTALQLPSAQPHHLAALPLSPT